MAEAIALKADLDLLGPYVTGDEDLAGVGQSLGDAGPAAVGQADVHAGGDVRVGVPGDCCGDVQVAGADEHGGDQGVSEIVQTDALAAVAV